MDRCLYDADHESYRDVVRTFFEQQIVPHLDQWDRDCLIDRSVFPVAAEKGVYALEVPESFGGADVHDYRYRMVVNEEAARVNAAAVNMTFGLFDDICLGYLTDLTTDEQKQRWLPRFAKGSLITAIGMTEPEAGSDLRGLRTTARRDGGDWILNGSKTFITSGTSADLVIVAARTESTAGGFSLFGVESDMPGFGRGRKLEKIGLHAQDTAELFFEDVRIPAGFLIGTEGRGLAHLMVNLPRERLGIIASAYTFARAIFDQTLRYCFDRKAFGSRIGDLQYNRFLLAEIATELDVAESYLDRCVRAFNDGTLTAVDAAKGKWYLSELQKRVVDRCVQLHGGYGYMLEYPVARSFLDTRAQTIYGGTTEIMKEIIGRDLTPSA